MANTVDISSFKKVALKPGETNQTYAANVISILPLADGKGEVTVVVQKVITSERLLQGRIAALTSQINAFQAEKNNLQLQLAKITEIKSNE